MAVQSPPLGTPSVSSQSTSTRGGDDPGGRTASRRCSTTAGAESPLVITWANPIPPFWPGHAACAAGARASAVTNRARMAITVMSKQRRRPRVAAPPSIRAHGTPSRPRRDPRLRLGALERVLPRRARRRARGQGRRRPVKALPLRRPAAERARPRHGPASGGGPAGGPWRRRPVPGLGRPDRGGGRRTWPTHGVEIEEGPTTRHGGRGRGTSVYFRDPDGSLLEFISYR